MSENEDSELSGLPQKPEPRCRLDEVEVVHTSLGPRVVGLQKNGSGYNKVDINQYGPLGNFGYDI
jgi:hypothetical protein